jgi:hypothetical protein
MYYAPVRSEPSGGASGQASDIAIHAKEILRVRHVLTQIYQRHCGQEAENVEEGMKRFGTFTVFTVPRAICRLAIGALLTN